MEEEGVVYSAETQPLCFVTGYGTTESPVSSTVALWIFPFPLKGGLIQSKWPALSDQWTSGNAPGRKMEQAVDDRSSRIRPRRGFVGQCRYRPFLHHSTLICTAVRNPRWIIAKLIASISKLVRNLLCY